MCRWEHASRSGSLPSHNDECPSRGCEALIARDSAAAMDRVPRRVPRIRRPANDIGRRNSCPDEQNLPTGSPPPES